MKALNTRLLHLPEPWFFYATLLMLILAAAVSYTFIEAPVRRWVNKGDR
jgi:peptidoglycan/LPS O-acetylase OafA/YrhL